MKAGGHGDGAAAAPALGCVAAAGERWPGEGGGRIGSGGRGVGLTLSLCPQVSAAAAAAGAFPKRVKVVEVGPRDGLQNEKVRAGRYRGPAGLAAPRRLTAGGGGGMSL